MIDRWEDLPQLRADGRRVLCWIGMQGVVMCCDPTERKRAKAYLLPVFRALEVEGCHQRSGQPPRCRAER